MSKTPIASISQERPFESEESLRLVLNSVQTGIVIIDAQTESIADINQYAAEMIGLPKTEITGKPIQNFLSYPTEEKNLFSDSKPGTESSEQILIKPDGQSVPILRKSTSVHIKKREFFIVSFADISEQVRAKEEFLKAKVAAEMITTAKSDLLANASHEIRTPMNGIIGIAGILLNNGLTPEQKGYVETIRNSADSLMSIINEILDFSRFEAGKMDIETLDFDMRIMIEEVCDLLSVKAYEKGLDFECMVHHDVLSFLKGDPGRLRQVLINLIGNAIKFTESGKIIIKVISEHEDEHETTIRFSISDTGIGISEDRIGNLFKPFSQADSSTTRHYGGTGLGLVIAKRIVEIMNGEIGVDSKLNKGSTFWFKVTLKKQIDGLSKEPAVPVDIQGKRILIVDNNAISRHVLKEHIKSWNCLVDEAENGEIALMLMDQAVKEENPFCLAIIDMKIPEMNGKTLGRRIKNNPKLTDTVLVMLTSAGKRGDAESLQDIGFSAYLTKPVKRQKLYHCLSTVLGMPLTVVKKPSKPIVTRHALSEEKKRCIRILLVEDNPVNQKVAEKMLEKFGYYSDIAKNGLEAIKALSNKAYDLVFMDVVMPEMDGYDATVQIRNPLSSVINHKVPVIAMTAHAMKGDREKCLEKGMDDYISKPVNPQELLKAIEKWVPRG